MTGTLRVTLLASLAAASVLVPATTMLAQNAPPPDHPAVTVKGQTYTPRSILARNMGTHGGPDLAIPAAQGHRQHLLRRHADAELVPHRHGRRGIS